MEGEVGLEKYQRGRKCIQSLLLLARRKSFCCDFINNLKHMYNHNLARYSPKLLLIAGCNLDVLNLRALMHVLPPQFWSFKYCFQ